MTTNVTVAAIDGPVVIYLQDGSTLTIEAGEEQFVQLPEAHMCTVSDTPPKEQPVEGEEHPPPGYVFAKSMVEFWQGMVAQIEQPEVNPL